MLFTILISIVFVAEIIIAFTLIKSLLNLDRAICEVNETVNLAKDGIKDISELARKISEQMVDIASDYVDKIKRYQEETIMKQLSKALIALVLVKANVKAVNKFRRSRIGKTLAKGLSMLEIMV